MWGAKAHPPNIITLRVEFRHELWGGYKHSPITTCYSGEIVKTYTSDKLECDAGGGNPLTDAISQVFRGSRAEVAKDAGNQGMSLNIIKTWEKTMKG